MLKIICGEWGTGKSTLMYERIKELSEEGKKICLFVPDQFSFEAEKIIYRKIPRKNAENVSVTMFSRMARSILSLYGEQKEYADDIVKNMLMLRALREKASEGSLELYGSQYKKKGFPDFALKTVGELRNAGLSTGRLRELVLSGEDFSEMLGKKLNDICEIYSAYDRLLSESFDDRLDDIRRASEIISQTDLFNDTYCFFDCFDSFTGSQLCFVKSLLLKAPEVTFTVTADSPDSKRSEFLDRIRLIGRLQEMAGEKGEITVLSEKYRNKSLVNAVEAKDMWQECDYICARIRELTDMGYRFRDIAVLTPTDKYGPVLSGAMKRYGIPCFMDIPESVISKSFVRFAIFTLKALSFETEDILRYAKSGFVRRDEKKVISDIDLDSLERFVRKYDIRKKDWKKDWSACFKDEEDRENTADLEAVRKSIILPLEELKRNISDKDGEVITKELCDFICNKMDINATIYGKCLKRNKEGEPLEVDNAKMDAYSSLWDDVVTVFESAYRALSGYRLSVEEYTDILTSALSSVTVSNPPQVLDAVTVGDTKRSRFDKIKAVFICGFNEGVFPAPPKVSEAFTSSENEILARHGIAISSDRLSRYSEELFELYRCLEIPEERLYISYPIISDSFAYLEPSSRLAVITEKYGIAVESAEEFGAEFYCRTEKASEKYLASVYSDYGRKRDRNALCKIVDKGFCDMLFDASGEREDRDRHILSKENAEKLLPLPAYSPTAFTVMGDCKFRYFCRYGLRLSEDETREIDKLLVGNVIHFCLWRLFGDYLDKREEFVGLPDKEIRKHIDESTDEYIRTSYPDELGGSERFTYLVKRIGNFAYKSALKMQEEIKESGFYPEALEQRLEFNFGDIRIKGFCDRVDSLIKDGKKYIRVIDYKRGSREFDLTEIYNGGNLQMLIYLFGLCEDGALPSSVMYIPVGKDSLYKGYSGDPERARLESEKAYVKNHSPHGLIIEGSPEKEELISLENRLSERYGNARNGYIKMSEISGSAFESLKSYCRSFVNAKVGEVVSGMAGACPTKSESCDYCEYSLFCGVKEDYYGKSEED